MRTLISVITCLVIFLTAGLVAQEVIVPLPQGEGYSVKKEVASPNARWELKVVGQGSPLAMSDRIILSPASFYFRDIPIEVLKQQLEEAPAQAGGTGQPRPMAMQAGMGRGIEMEMGMMGSTSPRSPGGTTEEQGLDESVYSINRVIKPDSPADSRKLVDSFLKAYNQQIEVSPPDEPIELIIEKAAWQFWYNQMILWEEYIQEEVFLKRDYESSLDQIDFTNKQTLNASLANLANEMNEEAKQVSAKEHNENIQFLHRLKLRELKRVDYRQWLENQKELVIDFTHNWARREAGQEIEIEGTVYLVSEEPLEIIPRNTVNVVTEKLTPYDILNADGTLRKPLD